jgi:hypothetical protein
MVLDDLQPENEPENGSERFVWKLVAAVAVTRWLAVSQFDLALGGMGGWSRTQ